MTKARKREDAQLQISCINKQLMKEFKEYAIAHKTPYHQLLSLLWDNFKYSSNRFTEEEKYLIDEAVQTCGEPIEVFKKSAIVKAAKRIITDKDKPISIREVNINSRTSTKAADLRVAEIIFEMMLHNEQADHWYERRFISQKAVADYARERKAQSADNLTLNIGVIKRYLLSHQEEIEQHHLKYNMKENHNRKVFNYKRMQHSHSNTSI
jgi:hypothetical protein